MSGAADRAPRDADRQGFKRAEILNDGREL
jgi:hypothetical protein